jgi:hypothetical protein
LSVRVSREERFGMYRDCQFEYPERNDSGCIENKSESLVKIIKRLKIT